MKKIIGGLVLALLGISTVGLWFAQHYWIDMEELPISPMPAWKISALKASYSMPWPASEELHLERTFKLSNAILHQQGDISLSGLLARLNESLALLNGHAQKHDLSQYPQLEYRRLLEQVTLMHRGIYFLAKVGRQSEANEKFRNMEIAYQKLENPQLEDKLGFYVERFIHEVAVNNDVPRAAQSKSELLSILSENVDGEVLKPSVDLYFGYALCLIKSQEGADLIQTSIRSIPRNAVIWLTARNWDTGLLSGIVLENQDGSACKNVVEHVLTLMKSKGE